MKIFHYCLTLIVLMGICPGGEETEGKKSAAVKKAVVPPSQGPWEFKKTDGHLWLHFHSLADKEKYPIWPYTVQLAGVDMKFLPLVYFKGNEDERKRQTGTNDEIAAFIAEQLKGRKVWIDDVDPLVFAGPGQIMGIVWLDPNRKQSLQQLLVKNGLAAKQ